MNIHYSRCLSEIYRLLPVIGILLLALLGIWWGSRTAAVNETVPPPDLRTSLRQPALAAKRTAQTSEAGK